MELIKKILAEKSKNFVFVGEAGSGKSEIAINFAHLLLKNTDKKIHFFDLDMTKPLFRSRDLYQTLEDSGVIFHYQEQFMDAPTLVGGVRQLLRDESSFVIIDVGGDHIGARAIGGFASDINKENTVVYYVINAYRPWSYDIEHIDKTLIDILGTSRVRFEKLRLISNPNVGSNTKSEEFISGHRKVECIVKPYMDIDFACAHESIYDLVKTSIEVEVMQLHLYLTYPWLQCE